MDMSNIEQCPHAFQAAVARPSKYLCRNLRKSKCLSAKKEEKE